MQPPLPATLYAHTLRVALASEIHAPRTEYLVEDLRTREVLADTFAEPEQPVPVGSLLKPFVAFAHIGPLPTVVCHGRSSGCWRPGGHGPMTLSAALGASCNAYFLALAAGREDPARIRLLGLSPPAGSSAADLIGLTSTWPISPLALAEAYLRLIPQASPAVLAGMRLSAQHGTAARIASHPGGVLAKTGTAPCVSTAQNRCTASGDGWTVAMVPALHPTMLILVRRRGTTGAVTAATARQIVSVLEHLHAR